MTLGTSGKAEFSAEGCEWLKVSHCQLLNKQTQNQVQLFMLIYAQKM